MNHITVRKNGAKSRSDEKENIPIHHLDPCLHRLDINTKDLFITDIREVKKADSGFCNSRLLRETAAAAAQIVMNITADKTLETGVGDEIGSIHREEGF